MGNQLAAKKEAEKAAADATRGVGEQAAGTSASSAA